jgi:RNA ligase
MRYEFPEIRYLDDVRPAIEGRDEFIIAERPWGYVVNYMVNLPDTFPEVKTTGGSAKMRAEQTRLKAIRRECRGILFYPDGRIMARRLHKFFNVSERDETQAHLIDLTQPHVILEKMDGSMITPMVAEGRIRFGTKMGITDVSRGAESFAAQQANIMEFCDMLLDRGKTPVFEWCSRQQRIVIDYPQDRLVLIAIRDNITGRYDTYAEMQEWARQYGLDLVKTYPGTINSMEHLIEDTRGLQGAEGWILRFDDGQMLKIKGSWYVQIHKVKDSLTQEKNVVDMLVNEKVDDAKSFMASEDRQRIEQFEDQFWHGFDTNVRVTEILLNTVRQEMQGDRKRFAIEHAPMLQPVTRAVLFSCWEGERNVRDELLNTIKKNTGTQTKIDSVRWLWGDVKWSYGFESDS